jgi:hypothetical protein
MKLRARPTFRRNISPPTSGSKSKPSKLTLPPASTGFLLGLLFDPEDGGDMFPLNVGLSLNYMERFMQLNVYYRVHKSPVT